MDISHLSVDDVVVAPCYFYDKATKQYDFEKARCFVIEEIDTEKSECMLRSISTTGYEYSHKIQDFKETGLDQNPSFIHCTADNLARFKSSLINRKIGRLTDNDADLFLEKSVDYQEYGLKKELISTHERLRRHRKSQQER